jgi:hypothetical protein
MVRRAKVRRVHECNRDAEGAAREGCSAEDEEDDVSVASSSERRGDGWMLQEVIEPLLVSQNLLSADGESLLPDSKEPSNKARGKQLGLDRWALS